MRKIVFAVVLAGFFAFGCGDSSEKNTDSLSSDTAQIDEKVIEELNETDTEVDEVLNETEELNNKADSLLNSI